MNLFKGKEFDESSPNFSLYQMDEYFQGERLKSSFGMVEILDREHLAFCGGFILFSIGILPVSGNCLASNLDMQFTVTDTCYF